MIKINLAVDQTLHLKKLAKIPKVMKFPLKDNSKIKEEK